VGAAPLDIFSPEKKAKRKARRIALRTPGSALYAKEAAKRSGRIKPPKKYDDIGGGYKGVPDPTMKGDNWLETVGEATGLTGAGRAIRDRAKRVSEIDSTTDAVKVVMNPLDGVKTEDAVDLAVTAATVTGAGAIARAARLATKARVERIGKIARDNAPKGPRAKRTKSKQGPVRIIPRGKAIPKSTSREVVRRGKPRKARRVSPGPKPKQLPPGPSTAVVKSTGKPRKGIKGKVRDHPILSTGAVLAAADQSGVDLPVVNEVGALAEGHARAVIENPVKTAKTTGRAIPGILTGVAAPVAAAAQSYGRALSTAADKAGAPTKSYSAKEIASPTVETVKEQWEGTKQMAKPLLSGDADKVQEAVENDLGLILAIPGPKIVSAARGSKVYKKGRSKVREGVKAKRDARDARDARTKSRADQKVRHRSKDRDMGGEEYILRRTGQKIENRRSRVETSREVARGKAEAQKAADIENRRIKGGLQSVSVPKGKSKKDYRRSAADSVAFVAQYGIPRDRAAAMDAINKAEADIAPRDRSKDPKGKPADKTDHDAIKFLRENPEVLGDKGFRSAVDTYKAAARDIETSDVKKYRAVGSSQGVKSPEARMAEGVRIEGKLYRTKPAKPDVLERRAAKVRQLRKEAKQHRKDSQRHEPGSPEFYVAVAREAKAKEKADEIAENLRIHNLVVKKARKDFVEESKGVVRERGLEEPAYVKDWQTKEHTSGYEQRSLNRMVSAHHASEDKIRKAGKAERDIESVLANSVATPRNKRIMHRVMKQFVAREKIKVNTPKGAKSYLPGNEIWRAIKDGEIDAKNVVAMDAQHFRSAVMDGFSDGAPLVRDLKNEIRERTLDPGKKYIVVNRSAGKELDAQIRGMDGIVSKANRGTSRVILGYNPSWAAAQFLAEGIPAGVAIGANPMRYARVAKAQREMAKADTNTRASVDSLTGQTAGIQTIPKSGWDYRAGKSDKGIDLTPGSRSRAEAARWAKGNGLSDFDRLKGGGIRKAVLAAKVDKEINGMLRGFGGVIKIEDSLRKSLKGKPLAEQVGILSKHPKAARQLEGYLDDVMGNWRAVTHLEKKMGAPAVAFYPYVRYALKSGFWGFPKQHPIKSTMLAFLSQVNAEQLEQIAGGKPVDWIDYAFPVTWADGKPQVLPAGARIAPPLNAAVEAIGSGNINRIIGGLNPAAGPLIQAATGTDPFTGEQISADPTDKVLLALAAMVSMFAPARWADDGIGQDGMQVGPVKVPAPITSYKPRRTYPSDDNPRGVIRGGRSATSDAFRATDPNRLQRGMFNVLAPQAGEDYRDRVDLQRDLEKGIYPESATSTTEDKQWWEDSEPTSSKKQKKKQWWQE
jgi:hypothetical protein